MAKEWFFAAPAKVFFSLKRRRRKEFKGSFNSSFCAYFGIAAFVPPLFSSSTEIKDFFLDSFHGGKRTSATEVFRLHPDILRDKDVEGDRRAEL